MLYLAGCLTFLKIVPKDRAKAICSINEIPKWGKWVAGEKEDCGLSGLADVHISAN